MSVVDFAGHLGWVLFSAAVGPFFGDLGEMARICSGYQAMGLSVLG
jgi:hypothetical protein